MRKKYSAFCFIIKELLHENKIRIYYSDNFNRYTERYNSDDCTYIYEFEEPVEEVATIDTTSKIIHIAHPFLDADIYRILAILIKRMFRDETLYYTMKNKVYDKHITRVVKILKECSVNIEKIKSTK